MLCCVQSLQRTYVTQLDLRTMGTMTSAVLMWPAAHLADAAPNSVSVVMEMHSVELGHRPCSQAGALHPSRPLPLGAMSSLHLRHQVKRNLW